jgi:hypothetical protein
MIVRQRAENPDLAVGTRDAFNSIQTGPQLANRFESELIDRWTMTDELSAAAGKL